MSTPDYHCIIISSAILQVDYGITFVASSLVK